MQELNMTELNWAEINEVSGGGPGSSSGTPAPMQTVEIRGKRMTAKEKEAYDREESANCWFHGSVDAILDWLEKM